jgi:hypothetical protein
MPLLTPPPTPIIQRGDRATFSNRLDAFITWLINFITEMFALVAGLNTLAAGSAYAIPYTVDLSSTVDADPTSGKLRFNAVNQNAATMLFADLVGADTVDYTTILDQFDASTSIVKGQIRIVKQGDPTKFLAFDVTARTTAAGYRKLTVANTGSSSSNPFAANDSVVVKFTRTGDVGSAGTLVRRTASVATDAAPAPSVISTDVYEITALAANTILQAPTGIPSNGQTLMFRIRDNGTARTIAYTSVYRAPVEIPFPSTTVVGKWTYLGFIYNAADAKWDLLAAVSNM